MNKTKLIFLALFTVFLSGCFGTYNTRIMDHNQAKDTSWAGKYPYQAVALDVDAAANPRHGGAIVTIISIISIPLDLVVDTILLPVDLIMWPLGFEKR
ncbi:MAG TPA: YceK/YidQ family lipoprotein [Gammaproteobacteria bacterium]